VINKNNLSLPAEISSGFRALRLRVDLLSTEKVLWPADPDGYMHQGVGGWLHMQGCPNVMTHGAPCADECTWRILNRPSVAPELYEFKKPPAALALSVLLPGSTHLAAGEGFAVEVVLVGPGVDKYQTVLGAIEDFGINKASFIITSVSCLTPRGYEVIYEKHLLSHAEPYIFTWEILERMSLLFAEDELCLRFLTPATTGSGQKMIGLTFKVFIEECVARIRALLLVYFLSIPPGDALKKFKSWRKEVLDAASFITTTPPATVQWINRSYHRNDRVVPTGGIVGLFRYYGEMRSFLPLALAGELLNIGKHTALGNGVFRICRPEQAEWLAQNNLAETLNEYM